MTRQWPYQDEAVFSLLEELSEEGHTSDFQLARYDGRSLLLIGSFDLDYYHQVEVLFEDVFYIQMSTSMLPGPQVRFASSSEIPNARALDPDPDDRLYAVISDTHEPNPVYFIGAKSVKARKCQVYHYQREDLQPGEEIWEQD